MTSHLKFDNITGTTADIKLSDVVRIAIRQGWVDLGASASEEAPLTAIATREDIKFSGGHMFQLVEHNGPVETIPQGCIPANGQKIYQNSYPVQYDKIIAGHQFVVSEVLWNTGTTENPDAYKGCWSLGGEDEFGKWIRVPKLNADVDYRAPFLRGSEIGVDAGTIVGDAIRNITGTLAMLPSMDIKAAAGAVAAVDVGPSYLGGAVAGRYVKQTFAASRVVPTADENRPRYHGVIMCIRMFGTVSNPGSVDADQLATQLGVVDAQVQTLVNDTLTPAKLAAAFGGVNQSLATNGYQKLPGGLIIQWGEASAQTISVTVTLPISFPTLNLITCTFPYKASGDIFNIAVVTSKSNSQFSISKHNQSGTGSAPGVVPWIAIGH